MSLHAITSKAQTIGKPTDATPQKKHRYLHLDFGNAHLELNCLEGNINIYPDPDGHIEIDIWILANTMQKLLKYALEEKCFNNQTVKLISQTFL